MIQCMYETFDEFFWGEDRKCRLWFSHNDLDGTACFAVGNVVARHINRATGNDSIPEPNDATRKITIGAPDALRPYLEELATRLVNGKSAKPENCYLLITDLRVDLDTIKWLNENHYTYAIVDHHVWDNDSLTEAMTGTVNDVIVDEFVKTKSAAAMLYRELQYSIHRMFGLNVKFSFPEFEKWVTAVSDYDTGNWGDWYKNKYGVRCYSAALQEQLIFSNFDVRNSNYKRGYYLKLINKRFGYDARYASLNEKWYNPINAHNFFRKTMESLADKAFDRMYAEYECVKKSLWYTDNSPTDPIPGMSVWCPFSSPYISAISKKILEDNPNIDYLYYINANEDYTSIGIRSAKPGADCQKIAAYFGGGGHYHAAGFTVDDITLSLPFRCGKVECDSVNLRPITLHDD